MKIKETISTELSEALKWMLLLTDIEQVAEKFGMTTGTLRQVIYRQIPVSKNSHPAVIELTRVAISNANKVGQTLTHYAQNI